jgi:hypothetical protein
MHEIVSLLFLAALPARLLHCKVDASFNRLYGLDLQGIFYRSSTGESVFPESSQRPFRLSRRDSGNP